MSSTVYVYLSNVTFLAATKEQCIYVMSSVSSTRIEDVWSELQHSPTPPVLWMQLYMVNNRSILMDLVKKAEDYGFSAIVVTVDSPVAGQWKTSLPVGFADLIKSR